MSRLVLNPFTGTFDFDDAMIIGAPVIGGSANRILYEDSLGNLADSVALQFNGTNQITLNTAKIAYDAVNNVLSINDPSDAIAIAVGPISTPLLTTLGSLTAGGLTSAGYSSNQDAVFFLESKTAAAVGGTLFAGIFNTGAYIASGASLSRFAGHGYSPSDDGFPGGGYMGISADATWSGTSTPARITFYTTPIGEYDTAFGHPRMYIDNAGVMGFVGNNGYTTGTMKFDDQLGIFSEPRNTMNFSNSNAGSGKGQNFVSGTLSSALANLFDIFANIGGTSAFGVADDLAFMVAEAKDNAVPLGGIFAAGFDSGSSAQSGDTLATFGAFGNNNSGLSVNLNGVMSVAAAENWTSTACGTTVFFSCAPNGATTSASQIIMASDGSIKLLTSGSSFSTPTFQVLDTASAVTFEVKGDGKVGFFGVTPVAQPSAYTITNVTTDRAYNANSTTVDELADVLGTLIADLKTLGLVA